MDLVVPLAHKEHKVDLVVPLAGKEQSGLSSALGT